MINDADLLADKYLAIRALITLDEECAIALKKKYTGTRMQEFEGLLKDVFEGHEISQQKSLYVRVFERAPLVFQMFIQRSLMRVPKAYYWALKKSGIRHHAF